MNLIPVRLVSMALVAAIAGCGPPKEAFDQPAGGGERIFSSTGFSFLPPQRSSSWIEDFGEHQVLYFKKTDVERVSFYLGALEGPLSSTLSDKEALIALVRSKKEEWGEVGRYSETMSTFDIEEQQEVCVRYSLSAKDQRAKNRGNNDFLLMLSVGRFCLHPQDKTVAVDVFYSVRHVPQFDPQALIAEGEEFLKSLQFAAISSQSTQVQ